MPDGGADVDDGPSPDGDTDTDGPARHDERVDAEMDRLDDGGTVIGATRGTSGSDALPFVLAAREHFAAVGDVGITGDARVDAATARLEEIPDLPTADHVAVYDDVHRRLQDALSDADVR